jgi:hypothetical protein
MPACFVIVYRSLFNSHFSVSSFMICLRTKFPKAAFSSSLYNKAKAKCVFRAAAMLLFYILQKNVLNSFHVFRSLLTQNYRILLVLQQRLLGHSHLRSSYYSRVSFIQSC